MAFLVENRLTRGDPAHVARAEGADRRPFWVGGLEQGACRSQRGHEVRAAPGSEWSQHGFEAPVLPLVDRGEGGSPVGGEGVRAAAAVLAAFADDQARGFEATEDAADVAGIHAQRDLEVGRDRRSGMGDLEEDAGSGQRHVAAEEARIEDADELRVESVEAADGGDTIHAARSHVIVDGVD